MMSKELHVIGSTSRPRARRKTTFTITALTAAVIVVASVYLMAGNTFIGPIEVWQSMWGGSDSENGLIVQTLRAPRLVVALLVGASLAMSGAILQAVIRNPLAAPDVVGITGGASLGAVLFITLLGGSLSIRFLPAAAIAGAVLAASLVYMLAWRKGVNSLRLVLVGVGVSSLLSAVTSFLLTFSDTYSAASAYIWLTGTIYASSWEHTLTLLPWTAVLCLIVYLQKKNIDAQLLGDELGTGIGLAVQRQRLLLVLLSVGLAGSAVAIGGAIGFVGLVAPHMARRLVGPVMRRMLPVSALLGALIVAAADLAGRTLFLPHDIPVGVFTSAIGAPLFVYLLYRSRHKP